MKRSNGKIERTRVQKAMNDKPHFNGNQKASFGVLFIRS